MELVGVGGNHFHHDATALNILVFLLFHSLAKLGIFYFFFYLGLAGFFCAMLGVFMALSPRDKPAMSRKHRVCGHGRIRSHLVRSKTMERDEEICFSLS